MKKDIKVLLKKRAQEMAKVPDKQQSTDEVLSVIAFTLAVETYGIESKFIREIYPLKEYTPLPAVPDYVMGLINIRGQILPLLDLRKFFNHLQKGLGELNKVIVLQDESMEFGILADSVVGIQTIYKNTINSVPPTITGIKEEYVKGIAPGNLILLDAKVLLNDKSLIVQSASEE